MRKLLFAVFMVVMLGTPALAATSSVYTDLDRCKSEDTGEDRFFYECKSPDGRVVSFLYDEGRARIIVDFDLDSPSAGKIIEVGLSGRVFGKKAEWRMRNGKACAVTIRVNTTVGSRLIVTSLIGPARQVGSVKGNEEARRLADAACN